MTCYSFWRNQKYSYYLDAKQINWLLFVLIVLLWTRITLLFPILKKADSPPLFRTLKLKDWSRNINHLKSPKILISVTFNDKSDHFWPASIVSDRWCIEVVRITGLNPNKTKSAFHLFYSRWFSLHSLNEQVCRFRRIHSEHRELIIGKFTFFCYCVFRTHLYAITYRQQSLWKM